MITAAVLALFVFGLGLLLWRELGPNGAWAKACRASEDLDANASPSGDLIDLSDVDWSAWHPTNRRLAA